MTTGNSEHLIPVQGIDPDSEEPVAAIMFDLNHFKQINDSHGHEVGDAALRKARNCSGQDLRQGFWNA